MIANYSPSISELARLMPSRTSGRWTGGTSAELAFTDNERVQEILDSAIGVVAALVGNDKLDARFYAAARSLILLKAALLIEPALWPEQARPEKSAWEQWQAQYKEDKEDLIDAIRLFHDEGEEDEGPGSSQLPIGSFPAPAPPEEAWRPYGFERV